MAEEKQELALARGAERREGTGAQGQRAEPAELRSRDRGAEALALTDADP